MPFQMQTITAFVAKDEQGDEGLLGFLDGDTGTWVPLVCADENRVSSMYPMAMEITKHTGQSFQVIQFSVRTDITEETNAKYGK